jgi:LysR family transcriptional regulator, low CO2-responsive transcriptional regulator
LEFHQLRYFVSAIQLGSVKASAAEHFVTAPAVSIQLKLLEEELGSQLFVKHAEGLKLTHAGEVFLPHAEELLQKASAVKKLLRRLQLGETGFLKLGSIDAASIYVLPKPLQLFRKRYPGVEITVEVMDSSQLLQLLEKDKIELAIVTLPIPELDWVGLPIFADPMLVVAPPGYPIARKSSLAELADGHLITYPADSTTRQLIDKVFMEHGFKLRPAMELSSPEAMKCLAQAGLGACILPKRIVAAEIRSGSLKHLRLPKVKFERTLGVVYKNAALLSKPATEFLRMLQS